MTVSTQCVEPFVGSTPYSRALDVLAAEVSTNRRGAWRKVLPLVPEYSRDIRDLVRALARTQVKYKVKTPAKQRKYGVCTTCHRELPHRGLKAHQIHGHFARLIKTRLHRWDKYPSLEDRAAQTASARRTVLAERHDRWLTALRTADPTRAEHLISTLGRSGAIDFFRSLPRNQQKRLLKLAPKPPRRLYKGEILVRTGQKPYREPSPGLIALQRKYS